MEGTVDANTRLPSHPLLARPVLAMCVVDL
jgi:hypothetical protein